MLKIEYFAKQYLGVELTQKQLDIIGAISNGKVAKAQRNVVNRVIRAYIKGGLQKMDLSPTVTVPDSIHTPPNYMDLGFVKGQVVAMKGFSPTIDGDYTVEGVTSDGLKLKGVKS